MFNIKPSFGKIKEIIYLIYNNTKKHKDITIMQSRLIQRKKKFGKIMETNYLYYKNILML